MTPQIQHPQQQRPFWADNCDRIVYAAFQHYPDLNNAQACTEWFFGFHMALALNAAERIFTMSAGAIDPILIANESRNAIGAIFDNALEIFRFIGADSGLIALMAQAVHGTFCNRFDELCRCAPTAGGCA